MDKANAIADLTHTQRTGQFSSPLLAGIHFINLWSYQLLRTTDNYQEKPTITDTNSMPTTTDKYYLPTTDKKF